MIIYVLVALVVIGLVVLLAGKKDKDTPQAAPLPVQPAPPSVAPPEFDLRPLQARRDAAYMDVGAAEASYRSRPPVDPVDFGALGDGVHDDTAAIMSAVLLGPVNGRGRTYAVRNLEIDANEAIIMDATFVELDNLRKNARTLSITSPVAVLSNVTVRRTGNGFSGSQSDASGILISNSRVTLFNVTVTGSSQGTGIKLVNCRGRAFQITVQDNILSVLEQPRDDLQDGIWIINCDDLVVMSPRCANLMTDWGYGPTPTYSRGITFAGSQNCMIVDYSGSNVDQHIDITGDQNPRDITIFGGNAVGGRNFAVKCANSPTDILVLNFTATDISRTAFIASAPNDVLPVVTSKITFRNCTAIRTGTNRDQFGIETTHGFKVETTSAYPQDPKQVSFISCTSDGQGLTDYGFLNQSEGSNTATSCGASGSRQADFSGF